MSHGDPLSKLIPENLFVYGDLMMRSPVLTAKLSRSREMVIRFWLMHHNSEKRENARTTMVPVFSPSNQTTPPKASIPWVTYILCMNSDYHTCSLLFFSRLFNSLFINNIKMCLFFRKGAISIGRVAREDSDESRWSWGDIILAFRPTQINVIIIEEQNWPRTLLALRRKLKSINRFEHSEMNTRQLNNHWFQCARTCEIKAGPKC